MDKRLSDVLNNQEDNYLLPFFWIHRGDHEKIPAEIQAVYDSGARALCVESRPHEDFCGDDWWKDMDLILETCAKLEMKVWILDDKHFPTGYANGKIESHYPNLRKWHLREAHVDVMGPQVGSSILMDTMSCEDEEELIAAYAYRRLEGDGEQMEDNAIDLSKNIHGNFLYWDIPEGVYRIFMMYKTRKGTYGMQKQYIDMLNPESVRVLIEAVYEPHYVRYSQYFGNTLVGFFSDEPSLGNEFLPGDYPYDGMYYRTLGKPGLALPWSDKIPSMMEMELGYDATPYLPGLWYEMGNDFSDVRIAYMNTVTLLWQDSFSMQLGNWCRERGVSYTGHIIEDMNAHARLGCSGGHYFRSLEGQTMAGIDIVLHQVMPGFAHYRHTASCAGGMVEPKFFHYVLAKLAASHAHINPNMGNRAMCEVFGAYGWAEGVPMMKFLIDHLLVRGINHFVPHAFSPIFPDPDAPPHFYANGQNPQFSGFSELMRYTNKISHLLYDTKHVANAVILYHAEAEWSGKSYMLMEEPAKALYDSHIDYDIIPIDYLLSSASVESRKLCIQQETYDCLVIPATEYLPSTFIRKLEELVNDGLPIYFSGYKPENCHVGIVASVDELSQILLEQGFFDIKVEDSYPLLRHYHGIREGTHYFMFVNESAMQHVQTKVHLPCTGNYTQLELLLDESFISSTKTGEIGLDLLPLQSLMIIFDEACNIEKQSTKDEITREAILSLTYEVSTLSSDEMNNTGNFKPYGTINELVNMTAPDNLPDFSGLICYQTSFDTENAKDAIYLDIGTVGQCARVHLNGVDLGERICAPYRWRVEGLLKEKDNQLKITVANTLVHMQPDPFSRFIQIPPTGLLGPVKLMCIDEE